jgi:hypothetical protein
LKVFEHLGFDEATRRITAWDQGGRRKRLIDEIVPHFQ